jgi:hypothetical protein
MDNHTPVHLDRPPNSHRFDVFSPKLNRPLTLFSYSQIHQWLLLEAFPSIRSFCERPDYLALKEGKPVLIDFWIQRPRREEFLVMVGNGTPALELATASPLRVCYITPNALERWATLARNWQSMIPYMAAQRRWFTQDDVVTVAAQCDRPMTLGQLENKLSPRDLSWTRACVFTALAQGRIQAPSLRKEPWSLDTLILPTVRHGH